MAKRKSEPKWGGERAGAGRPAGPDGPAERISVRIPAKLLERLELEAEARGVSRSRALVAAIRAYLGEADD